MGAALTYARRYALFTLVGIAGEDDADAPDLCASPPSSARTASKSKQNGRPDEKAVLSPMESSKSRDCLLEELEALITEADLTDWAQRTLSCKGSLGPADVKSLEEAFAAKAAALAGASEEGAPSSTGHEANSSSTNRVVDTSEINQPFTPSTTEATADQPVAAQTASKRKGRGSTRIDKSTLAFPEPRRIRDKDHLKFVAQQPCLVCNRYPCDAHHLRFAQPRAIGMKVSDEFTVSLCRIHDRQLHDAGNEVAWWEDLEVNALEIARVLWEESHRGAGVSDPRISSESAAGQKTQYKSFAGGDYSGCGRTRNGRIGPKPSLTKSCKKLQ